MITNNKPYLEEMVDEVLESQYIPPPLVYATFSLIMHLKTLKEPSEQYIPPPRAASLFEIVQLIKLGAGIPSQ